MRDLTQVICCTAAVVAMTACGTQVTSTGSVPRSSEPSATSSESAPTATGGGSAPAPTPTGPGQPGIFPLTITRTGGIAGFRDVLVVAADGLVTVTRKAQLQQQCRLTPDAVKRLTTAAFQVRWTRLTPASTDPAFPDDMVILVRSPAGGPVRLDDPQVAVGGHFFSELLTDLGGGPAASRMCKPV